jgi:hypothetical protein
MATRVHRVPYGPPAALALVKAISSAKRDDLLAPVNVVIPSNHVGGNSPAVARLGRIRQGCPAGERHRGRYLSHCLPDAELLGAGLAQAGRRPVSTPVIAVALRAVLTENSGIFSAVAGHPATEAALVAAYRELRDLSPDALTRLAATSECAAEVARIHRAARARLEATYYDEEDLLDAAVLALGSDRVLGAFDVGPELLVSVAKERLFFDSEPLIFGNPGGMVLVLVRQGFQRLEACSVTP